MAYCTSTTLVFGAENANPESKSTGAEQGGRGDTGAGLSDEEHEDGDDSSEHDDDEEELDNTDEDDYYYDSEYEVSISSHKGKNASHDVAGNALNELEAFRTEWLQNLALDEKVQGQDGKRPENLAYGGGQGDPCDSDGLSVSRLWLGDDENRQQSEDLPSSSARVETIGQEMDEFEQEQLLQEEMWKYYTANREQREDGEASRYINKSRVTNLC